MFVHEYFLDVVLPLEGSRQWSPPGLRQTTGTCPTFQSTSVSGELHLRTPLCRGEDSFVNEGVNGRRDVKKGGFRTIASDGLMEWRGWGLLFRAGTYAN